MYSWIYAIRYTLYLSLSDSSLRDTHRSRAKSLARFPSPDANTKNQAARVATIDLALSLPLWYILYISISKFAR